MTELNNETQMASPFSLPANPILAIAGHYKGITIWGDTWAGEGFFISLDDVTADKIVALGVLAGKYRGYEREWEALQIVGRAAHGIEDGNLANWILEAIAEGDVSSLELRKRAREILTERAVSDTRIRRVPATAKRKSRGYVYILKCNSHYKIGATKNLARRMKELQASSPYGLQVIEKRRCEDMLALEAQLHEHFDNKRLHGEWFQLDDGDIEYARHIINQGRGADVGGK